MVAVAYVEASPITENRRGGPRPSSAPNLHERFIAGGMTSIGKIPENLQKLLDSQGKANLRNPGGGTWTVNDAENAITWVLGR